MGDSVAATDILEALHARKIAYDRDAETLVAERDEFHELVELFPILSDVIDACAEDVLKEYHHLKGRYSAVDRIIDRIQTIPLA